MLATGLEMEKIPVGVSQCLLGEPVRYDGGHKYNHYLTEQLQDIFEYRALCPEVSIGLGVPRKPINLIISDGQTRARTSTEIPVDVTDALSDQADTVARSLPDICGYIFMQKSPSSGLFNVKRFSEGGVQLDRKGRGVFAARLTRLMPLLPVEEAGRLADNNLRENFLIRVGALHDWRQDVAAQPPANALKKFYDRYQYQVMARSLPAHFELAHLLAASTRQNISSTCENFIPRFMAALNRLPSRRGNVQVMMYLRDRLAAHLTRTERLILSRAIEAYLHKHLSLEAILETLRQHLRNNSLLGVPSRSVWRDYAAHTNLHTFIFS